MKRVLFILIVGAVVVGLGVVGLRCGGPSESPAVERVKGEIAAGRQEQRNLQADELAALARDMRLMAQRYLQQGDKKKSQRAIGAAQELDKKISELRGGQAMPQ